MADIIGELVVQITGDTKQFDKSVDTAKKSTKKFGTDLKKFGDTAFKYATLPILAIGAAMVKTAIDIEKQKTAFGVLLKDVEKGNQLFSDLQTLASKTPLQLANITKSAQQLLAAGTNLNDLNDTITLLGDIALGDAAKLGTLTNAYAKMQTKGKATMEELNMVTEAGVPILQALADSLGVSVAQVFDLSSKGKIAFSDVQDAMKSLTSETGQFNKGMEKLSETTGGKLSTALDNIKISASEFGVFLLPAINDILEATTELFQEFNELSDETKKIILQFGGVVAILAPATKGVLALGKAFKFLSSPTGGIGLAIVAVAALIAGIKAWNKIKLEQDYGDVSKELGISLERVNKISKAFQIERNFGREFADTIREVSEQFEVTDNELVKILSHSKELTEEDENRIDNLNVQLERYAYLEKQGKTLAGQAKKDNDAELARLQELIDTADEKYDKAVKAVKDQDVLIQGVIDNHKTEIELIDEQIASITKTALAEGKYREDQKTAIKQLQADKKTILDQEVIDNKATNDKVLALGAEVNSKILALEQKLTEEKKALRNELIGNAQDVAGSLLDISNTLAENEIANITAIAEARINALNLETEQETELNAFKATLTAEELARSIVETTAKIADLVAIGTTDSLEQASALQRDLDNEAEVRRLDTLAVESRTARADEIAEVEKDLAKKKYELQLKQFKADKIMALIDVTIATAVGIAKAIPNIPLIIASAAVGTASTAAIIAEQAPPRPQFATGAIIQGSTRGVQAIVGEGNNDELILGGGSKGDAILSKFAEKINNKSGGSGGSGQTIININSLYPPRSQDLERLAKDLYTGTIKEQQRRGI